MIRILTDQHVSSRSRRARKHTRRSAPIARQTASRRPSRPRPTRPIRSAPALKKSVPRPTPPRTLRKTRTRPTPAGTRRSKTQSRGRIARPTVREALSASFFAVRTGLLGMLTIILAAALIILVPELEADSAAEADHDPPEGAVQAMSPSFEPPSIRSGLVDFELTDDIEHLVEKGETLIHIARRYQIAYQVIADYNDLKNPNSISVGQMIRIPGTVSRPIPGE